MKIDLIAFNCRYSHSCLALFYVRNELHKKMPSSCLATIRQFTINDPYFETLLLITGTQADALFFSVYIWNANYLCRLLSDIHAIAPDMPIVLGGPHAATLREKLSFEPTVVHQQIEGIDRTFYHDLADGTLQTDYRAAPISTFDYPYIQEDFESQLKNRNIYYESSRGCPFFCAYCLSSTTRGVLSKDIGQVKNELLDIIKQAPKIIRFVDRTFNADPERAVELWRFLQEHAAGDCAFHFEIAPDLFTEKMFSFLEGIKENFFKFEIGVQSTKQETLQAVNRNMDLAKAFDTIKRLKKIGTINLHVDLILGLPTENKESFAQSVRDVLALQPNYLQMGLLKVLPDTAVFKNKAEWGIIACQDPPYQVMATKWMDFITVSRLYWLGECIEAFYNKHFFKNFFSYALAREEDAFLFFDKIVTLCLDRSFYSLAKTQEFMNEILFSFIQYQENTALLRELLIFDWLLSGHRYLPDIFNENINTYKDFLWNTAAAELPDLYTEKERNLFFKRGVFFKFSSSLLSHCLRSPAGKDGFVVFFAEGGSVTNKKTIAVIME